ncbi:MAG: amino acid ABC transporter permease [Chloroflexi bacterium]|nr:amino acid ABC transporter permease [Chloroflexota bacterium]
MTGITSTVSGPRRTPWGLLTILAALGLVILAFQTGALQAAKWQPFLLPSSWGFFAEGLLVTLIIGGVSLAASVLLSLPLALARASLKGPARLPFSAWIEGVRATPVLVILVIVSFGLLRLGLDIPGIAVAIVGLTIYTSAVLAEILRAGILSIAPGEVDAARSLGLDYWRTMRYVVLPQAVSRMMPALVSQLITLIKDTSLAYIIAVYELVGHGRSFFNFYGNPVETYVVLALIYFVINFPLSLASRRLETKQPAAQRVVVSGEADQLMAAIAPIPDQARPASPGARS